MSFSNRISNRQSIGAALAQRKRRTTVLSGKELDNILEDQNFNEVEKDEDDVKNMQALMGKEEQKAMIIDIEPQDKLANSLKGNSGFQASFVTPPEEANEHKDEEDEETKMFDKMMESRLSKSQMSIQRKITITSRRGAIDNDQSSESETNEGDEFSRKLEDKDILQELARAEMIEGLEVDKGQLMEQSMDELMYQFDSIHHKNRATDVSMPMDDLTLKHLSVVERKTESNKLAKIQPQKQNVRFSISFDDRELKNQLVQSHSIHRKIQKQAAQSNKSDLNNTLNDNSRDLGHSFQKSRSELLDQLQEQESQLKDQYDNSNENSLGTEDDLDNYLEQLEEQDRHIRESRMLMESSNNNNSLSISKGANSLKLLISEIDKHEKLLENSSPNKDRDNSAQNQQQQPSNDSQQTKKMESLNHSVISLNKDLIDVIEELSEEENAKESDESFTKEFYQTMHQDVLMRGMNPADKRKSLQMLELSKDDWDYKDLIKIIDWNERRHQDMAKSKLKKNAELSLKNVSENQAAHMKTRILTSFSTLNSVSNKLIKERQFSQARATCVAISDDLLFVGNSEGQVWMFDREQEDEYSTFSEKSKEFLGNSVTCMDIHTLRTEYLALGYERGQMVLVDCTEPNKSIKVIKDHHKGVPVTNIKFCDWRDDKKSDQPSDKQSWMFISIDKQGKVLINTVNKVLFVMKSSKHIIIDPARYSGPVFSSIACRFSSQIHGQGIYDDMSIFAIGNAESVYIMEGRSNNHTEFLQINRPTKFFNRSRNQVEPFKPMMPSLSWGYGMSPVLKERPHSLLAIAWGPLIQLVVMIDHEDTDKPFITDGYYVLRHIDQVQNLSPQKPPRRSVRFLQQEEAKEVRFEDPAYQSRYDLELELDGSGDKNDNSTENTLDDSLAFSKPELYIEQLFFLSDSTMLVLTQNQEIRILFTQGFSPNVYSHDRAQKRSNLKKQSIPAELETGIRPGSLLKSEQGAMYHQTLKFFAGKLVVLTYKNVMTCLHLTWQQSIYEFKKQVEDDLIQVFSRALNIYKGKVKGYQGLPDNTYLRENFLKAELKLLVKEIIYQVIEKTKQINDRRAQTEIQNGDGTVKLEQYEDERKKKFETLIRIAIEFCVELKDCDFLFKDLFWLFQEEKLEELFVQELEPFIMAGKFQEWELPNDVIQNHVIRYYKDPQKAEALEKIIVNLNLNQCPKTIVLEFIHFSEQNFLTTAILFLYTQVFERKDNTSCVQVLFSLFDLYKKANKRNQASLIDIQMLKEASYDSQDKQQIEKSQIYLGYKILWVIRLFLNGKKFPQGNIREKKWKCYIHDIIQFLSNHEIIKVLLDIDAETLFQTIAILFYPSRPYDLVMSGRDDGGTTTAIDPAEQYKTHIDFIKDLDAYCLSKEAPEHIKGEYLFFVSNVVAKSKIEGIQANYFYIITRELLGLQKKYLEFNKKILEMANRKKKRLNERLSVSGDSSKGFKELESHKYISKTENDFLNLLKKSEPLDNFQIQELLKFADQTQFDLVKLFLLEKKEEYIKCLNMLLSASKPNELMTAEQQGEKVINWIREKVNLLEERSSRSIYDKNIFEQFKREVAQNIKKIVVLNTKEAIKLVDERFNGAHKEMIDSLSRDPIEQMLYLETLLDEQEQTIQDAIKNYGLQSSNPSEAKKYIEFLKLHLRLCCQHNKTKVFSIVEKMVKNSYYPIEDCLQICQEYNQIEAAFILNKKLGKYYDSVQQGIEIIKSKVDLTKLKIELYFARKNGISTAFFIHSDQLQESALFDQIFKKILKICSKNSKEVDHDKEELIWYIVIDALLEMRQNEKVASKVFCKQFFSERLNIFVQAMARAISFQKFLDHILLKYKDIQFKDFRHIILQMFYNQISEKVVLQNANNAIYKVNSVLFQSFSQSTRCGIAFRSRICFLCKRYMDSFLYDDEESTAAEETFNSEEEDEEDTDKPYVYDSAKELVKIFACRHTFHVRCLKKHYSSKPQELEELNNRKTTAETLRCPTCHIKSFEIESGNDKQTKARGFAQQKYDEKVAKALKANNSATRSDETDEDALQRKMQIRQARMTLKSQTLVNRQLERLQKKMDFYESSSEGYLNINNFRKI